MHSFYRKRKIIFILLIVVGVLSLSSITYAIFTVTTMQSGTDEINTMECLELTFSNQENNINLINTYPMTDERGAKNTPYTFTITNNCGTYIEYSVGLMIDNSNTLEDKYVKTMFSLKEDVGDAILLTDREEGKIYNDNKTYLFRRDGLTNGASKEYKLILWVDGSGTYETVTNKSFNGQIIINASPKSEEGKIVISADLDGGYLYQELNEVYRTGDKAILPSPVKDGYTFITWEVVSGDATLNGNTISIGKEDIFLKAFFKKGTGKTVTLDLDGGTTTQELEPVYYEDDVINLVPPIKDGYIFAGWTITSGSASISNNDLTIGKENVTIKAVWNVTISIRNAKGGTLYINNITKNTTNTISSDTTTTINVEANDDIRLTATPLANFSVVSVKQNSNAITNGATISTKTNSAINTSYRRDDFWLFNLDDVGNVAFSATKCDGACTAGTNYESHQDSTRHHYTFVTKSTAHRLDAVSEVPVDLTDFSQICSWQYTATNQSYVTNGYFYIGVLSSRSNWVSDNIIATYSNFPMLTSNDLTLCGDVSSYQESKYVGIQLLQWPSSAVNIVTHVHYVKLIGTTYV